MYFADDENLNETLSGSKSVKAHGIFHEHSIIPIIKYEVPVLRVSTR